MEGSPAAFPVALPPPIPQWAPAQEPLPDPAQLPETPLALPPAPAPPRKPVPGLAVPGLTGALGFLVLLFALQLLAVGAVAAVDFFIHRDLLRSAGVLGAINLVSFTVISWLLGRRMGVPVLAMLREAPPPGTFSVGNVLTLMCAIVGQLIFAVGCVYGLGGKNMEKSDYVERLNAIMGPGQAWWVVVPLLVLVAPFTEEVLFRGQFLRGFLARYATPLAIALSAAYFSAMHLNPVQIPATLMLGILSGILYERTRSVWPSIVAHMLNNAVPAMAIFQAGQAKHAAKAALQPAVGAALAMVAAGLAVWLLAVMALRRGLPAARTNPAPARGTDLGAAEPASVGTDSTPRPAVDVPASFAPLDPRE